MEMTGAIFDMDGVLFDTERVYQEIWYEIARERGNILPDDFAQRICGCSGEESAREVRRWYEVDDADIIRNDCYARMKERMKEHVPIKPGVPEMLMYLHERGIPVAVASGTYRDQVIHNLFKTGLADYVDIIVGGNQVAHGKPAPNIFLYAAELIQQDTHKCYVFEDSLNGVRAGFAAGAKVMMIPDLVPPTDEIRPMCHGIFHNMREALAVVKEEFEQQG